MIWSKRYRRKMPVAKVQKSPDHAPKSGDLCGQIGLTYVLLPLSNRTLTISFLAFSSWLLGSFPTERNMPTLQRNWWSCAAKRSWMGTSLWSQRRGWGVEGLASSSSCGVWWLVIGIVRIQLPMFVGKIGMISAAIWGISSQKGELKFADGGQQEFVSPGFTTGPMGFANKIRVYSPEMGYEPERMHQHV